jgi:uncharacterized protein
MKQLLVVWLIVLISCGSKPYETKQLQTIKTIIYSKYVKDSFEIYVTLPPNYANNTGNYSAVYYLDANLKSGNSVRKILDEKQKTGDPLNAVAIGIGHVGNYRVLRRRDFITPFTKSGDSLISNQENFGQSAAFYQFLQEELIPSIENSYRTSVSNKTLIGHSFGGLFACYALFKKERLFSNYVMLSPSLWVNYDNIYEFEKQYRKNSDSLQARVYMRAGSREVINKVLPACIKMNDFLMQHPYHGLQFDFKELNNEDHNSHVYNSIKTILSELP